MSVTAPPKEKKVPNSPVDPYKEGMDPVEQENYDNLRKSKKQWTPDEARGLATNPSDRLPIIKKNRLQKLYKDDK